MARPAVAPAGLSPAVAHAGTGLPHSSEQDRGWSDGTAGPDPGCTPGAREVPEPSRSDPWAALAGCALCRSQPADSKREYFGDVAPGIGSAPALGIACLEFPRVTAGCVPWSASGIEEAEVHWAWPQRPQTRKPQARRVQVWTSPTGPVLPQVMGGVQSACPTRGSWVPPFTAP